MLEQRLLTKRLHRAIYVAALAHKTQLRKSSDLPYIVHLFGTMYIASKVTSDEDILIACLFHDILEDVPEEYNESQMRADYGDRVVEIVKGVTKNDSLENWRERSEAYLAHLRSASEESVIVSAADKINNLQSILIDYEQIGDKVWDRFNSNKADQLWWYESILKILNERIPASPLTTELSELVATLKSKIG